MAYAPYVEHNGAQNFNMVQSGCEGHDSSNIDPSLWDAGASSVPASGVGSHFCVEQGYPQLRASFQHQQQQPLASPGFVQQSHGPYYLRSASQHQVASS